MYKICLKFAISETTVIHLMLLDYITYLLHMMITPKLDDSKI